MGIFSRPQNRVFQKLFGGSAVRPEEKSYITQSDYFEQVEETEARYRGTADYGVRMTRTLIGYRSSWILSSNAYPQADEGAKNEETFLKEFLQYNGIDSQFNARLGRIGEIYGHAIMVLMPNEKDSQIELKLFYPKKGKAPGWYDEIADTYGVYELDKRFPANQFVIANPYELYLNEDGEIMTPTNIGTILREIADIDRCSRDIREINNLFAHPTPVVEFTDQAMASQFADWIASNEDGQRWSLGKLLVLPFGTLKFISPDPNGLKSLFDEQLRLSQNVSGHTGAPIFLLGFPELIGGGRATAQEFAEGVNVATTPHRIAWQTDLLEMYRKAMTLYNLSFSKSLDPYKISLDLPIVSSALIEREMNQVKLLYDMKAVSRETILKKSGIIDDVQGELEKLDGEDQRFANNVLKGVNGL